MMGAYEQGRLHFKPGMSMDSSSECPHEGCMAKKPMSDDRIKWMNGFFDAYFQHMCDRNGLGAW